MFIQFLTVFRGVHFCELFIKGLKVAEHKCSYHTFLTVSVYRLQRCPYFIIYEDVSLTVSFICIKFSQEIVKGLDTSVHTVFDPTKPYELRN